VAPKGAAAKRARKNPTSDERRIADADGLTSAPAQEFAPEVPEMHEISKPAWRQGVASDFSCKRLNLRPFS
jgi:hypothetical protein